MKTNRPLYRSHSIIPCAKMSTKLDDVDLEHRSRELDVFWGKTLIGGVGSGFSSLGGTSGSPLPTSHSELNDLTQKLGCFLGGLLAWFIMTFEAYM